MVIKNIPIIKIPDHDVKFKIIKLAVVKAAPISISSVLVSLPFSNHLIRGISIKKIKKPLAPRSNPISSSDKLCRSL
jgi:hypothetical protein